MTEQPWTEDSIPSRPGRTGAAVTLRRLYVLLAIEVSDRYFDVLGVTSHPGHLK